MIVLRLLSTLKIQVPVFTLSPTMSHDSSSSDSDASPRPRQQRRLGLCDVCHASSAKYTCPACGWHSCSMPCVRRHKIANNCDGVKCKTSYVPLSAFDDEIIQQDFMLLSEAEHISDRAKRGHVMPGMSLSKAISVKRRKLSAACKEKGIVLELMPMGLERARLNSSHVVDGAIRWMIEFIFPGEEQKMIIKGYFYHRAFLHTHSVDERTTLEDCLFVCLGDMKRRYGSGKVHISGVELSMRPHVFKNYLEKDAEIQFFLPLHHVPNALLPPLIPLLPTSTLTDALTAVPIIEHPTIYVTAVKGGVREGVYGFVVVDADMVAVSDVVIPSATVTTSQDKGDVIDSDRVVTALMADLNK